MGWERDVDGMLQDSAGRSCLLLEEKSELVACRVDVLHNADVTIDLYIRRASIPFTLHRRCLDFVELGSQILLFGHLLNRIVVHNDL